MKQPKSLFLVGILILAFLPSPAWAALCYVSEYQVAASQDGRAVNVALETSIDQTPVNFGGGATSSAAFNSNTNFVRIWCDVQCSIKFGTAPTATNANKPLSAGAPEYFWVPRNLGWVVSCIANP